MQKKGFSLIELLIVIAIMAILGALALSAFTTARKQARDTQRKSEMTQYKTALESYFVSNSAYPIFPLPSGSGSPARSNGNEGIFQSGTTFTNTFMSGSVLQGVNPADGYLYYYISDGLNYKLWGEVELGTYFEICSSGKAGYVASTPASNLTCEVL